MVVKPIAFKVDTGRALEAGNDVGELILGPKVDVFAVFFLAADEFDEVVFVVVVF